LPATISTTRLPAAGRPSGQHWQEAATLSDRAHLRPELDGLTETEFVEMVDAVAVWIDKAGVVHMSRDRLSAVRADDIVRTMSTYSALPEQEVQKSRALAPKQCRCSERNGGPAT
jgi:hypothetical protein